MNTTTCTLHIGISADIQDITRTFERDALVKMKCHLEFVRNEERLQLVGQSIEKFSKVCLTLK
jgi:hypothetical protein